MTLIFPNNLDFLIPEHLSPASTSLGEAGRPVTFGTELEGMVPLSDFTESGKPLPSASEVYNQLAQRLQQATKIETRTIGAHTHRTWSIKDDETLLTDRELSDRLIQTSSRHALKPQNPADGFCKTEVTSSVLAGNDGLLQVRRQFGALKSMDFQTNASCALHVHVSLGWGRTPSGDFRKLNANELEEVKNVYRSFVDNQERIMEAVAPHRRTSLHCHPNLKLSEDILDACSSMVDLEREYSTDGYDRRHRLNLHAAKKYGTIEYKMREADNYTDSIGYIRFLVAFTAEAAQNPNISVDNVIDKYFIPLRHATHSAYIPKTGTPLIEAKY